MLVLHVLVEFVRRHGVNHGNRAVTIARERAKQCPGTVSVRNNRGITQREWIADAGQRRLLEDFDIGGADLNIPGGIA